MRNKWVNVNILEKRRLIADISSNYEKLSISEVEDRISYAQDQWDEVVAKGIEFHE